MGKENSKYRNTAKLMDEALLDLLAKKDFDFITVKEICAKAGVNRSTFYLHYESIDDLLAEANSFLMDSVFSYYPEGMLSADDLVSLPKEELVFLRPEYLVPYLHFIKDHQRIFLTVLDRNSTLKGEKNMEKLFQSHFKYVYRRFGLEEKTGHYISTFYMGGTLSVISAWLRRGCLENEEEIARLVSGFVPKIL